jgi:hypothetical protein
MATSSWLLVYLLVPGITQGTDPKVINIRRKAYSLLDLIATKALVSEATEVSIALGSTNEVIKFEFRRGLIGNHAWASSAARRIAEPALAAVLHEEEYRLRGEALICEKTAAGLL